MESLGSCIFSHRISVFVLFCFVIVVLVWGTVKLKRLILIPVAFQRSYSGG